MIGVRFACVVARNFKITVNETLDFIGPLFTVLSFNSDVFVNLPIFLQTLDHIIFNLLRSS